MNRKFTKNKQKNEKMSLLPLNVQVLTVKELVTIKRRSSLFRVHYLMKQLQLKLLKIILTISKVNLFVSKKRVQTVLTSQKVQIQKLADQSQLIYLMISNLNLSGITYLSLLKNIIHGVMQNTKLRKLFPPQIHGITVIKPNIKLRICMVRLSQVFLLQIHTV